MSDASTFGGQSMSQPLRRVLVCEPAAAGWSRSEAAGRWRELGYFHSPQADLATSQHQVLCDRLERAGVEILRLPAAEDLSLDAVYAHDASLISNRGAICLRMGKPSRGPESLRHAEFYAEQGIPVLGRLEDPGNAEAGDMVWLDESTLLIGRGYRTNREGIEQMRDLLSPSKVEVIEAPLPHGRGPEFCLHLMSLMSVLSENMVLVDLPDLAVSTLELLRDRELTLIEIERAEKESMACNVLSLGERRLVALEENAETNRKLKEAGFEVFTFPGSELCQNGSGGPTCLTRPLLRG